MPPHNQQVEMENAPEEAEKAIVSSRETEARSPVPRFFRLLICQLCTRSMPASPIWVLLHMYFVLLQFCHVNCINGYSPHYDGSSPAVISDAHDVSCA